MSWNAIAGSIGITLEQARYAGDLDHRLRQLGRYENPIYRQKQIDRINNWRKAKREYIEYRVWCKLRTILGPKADLPHWKDKIKGV